MYVGVKGGGAKGTIPPIPLRAQGASKGPALCPFQRFFEKNGHFNQNDSFGQAIEGGPAQR